MVDKLPISSVCLFLLMQIHRVAIIAKETKMATAIPTTIIRMLFFLSAKECMDVPWFTSVIFIVLQSCQSYYALKFLWKLQMKKWQMTKQHSNKTFTSCCVGPGGRYRLRRRRRLLGFSGGGGIKEGKHFVTEVAASTEHPRPVSSGTAPGNTADLVSQTGVAALRR